MLAVHSWARGMPSSVIDIPNDTLMEKTYFHIQY